MRDRSLREEYPVGPHPSRTIGCPCVTCDSWRVEGVRAGSVVAPSRYEKEKHDSPGWSPGTWKRTGWDHRLRLRGQRIGVVIGGYREADMDNGGHLDTVAVFWQDGTVYVTSRRWLWDWAGWLGASPRPAW